MVLTCMNCQEMPNVKYKILYDILVCFVVSVLTVKDALSAMWNSQIFHCLLGNLIHRH